jgi:hypothetical protein
VLIRPDCSCYGTTVRSAWACSPPTASDNSTVLRRGIHRGWYRPRGGSWATTLTPPTWPLAGSRSPGATGGPGRYRPRRRLNEEVERLRALDLENEVVEHCAPNRLARNAVPQADRRTGPAAEAFTPHDREWPYVPVPRLHASRRGGSSCPSLERLPCAFARRKIDVALPEASCPGLLVGPLRRRSPSIHDPVQRPALDH